MTEQPSSGSQSLTDELDNLLVQYLHLLDQYTILREQLSTQLSSGYFSLAQAQRSCTLGSGRRYGEDCYDERMKAVQLTDWDKEVAVSHAESEKAATSTPITPPEQRAFVVRIHDVRNSPAAVTTHHSSVSPTSKSEPQSTLPDTSHDAKSTPRSSSTPTPSREANPVKSLVENATSPREDSRVPQSPPSKDHPMSPQPQSSSSRAQTKRTHVRDPIHMFAALPPPPLRQAQKFFTSTLPTISNVLNTTSSLAFLEQKIHHLRAQFGDELEDIEHANPRSVADEATTRDSGPQEIANEQQTSAIERPVTKGSTQPAPTSSSSSKQPSQSPRKTKLLSGQAKSPNKSPRPRVLKVD